MDLRSYLRIQADKRKLFATQLLAEQKELNLTSRSFEKGSLEGKIHRGWMSFRSDLSFENDDAILEECIRGDKQCIKEYKEVWNDHKNIPSNLTATLSEQVAQIEQTLNTIKSLEDL